MSALSLLLVEDDETDVLLLQRAFKEVQLEHTVHVAHDGQAAIDFLSELRGAADDRLPALVLLDLKLPRLTGLDVLQWIRNEAVIRRLPVAVFSSSAHRADLERAYELGANAFIVKPPSIVQRRHVAQFIKDWLTYSHPPVASTEGLAAARTLLPSG